MKFTRAQRLSNLPVYLFARLGKMIQEKRAQGADVIDLGIGDPDEPTPDYIIDELCKEARNPQNHRYSSYFGMPAFRQAVAQWYTNRFRVELDSKSEVVTLIGSKEGIGHISWCYINPGDIALVPDPCYPVYNNGVVLAGGKPYWMPLKAENGFLPDFSAIPPDVAKKAKLMFLCYPNNPTGAIAPDDFFREAIAFAREYKILICHDVAYCDIAYEDYRPPSFLQFPGAKEVGVEFGSASKPYNMTGWRIGWCAGNTDVVEALGRLKSNLDTGQFQAIQLAAMKALLSDQSFTRKMCDIYRERRDICVDGLNTIGWNLEKPKGAFYIWAPVPAGYTSGSFAEMIFDRADVMVTPGAGYGPIEGDRYIRISLTVPTERLKEAIERIKKNVSRITF